MRHADRDVSAEPQAGTAAEIEVRYAMRVIVAADEAQIVPQFRIEKVRTRSPDEMPVVVTAEGSMLPPVTESEDDEAEEAEAVASDDDDDDDGEEDTAEQKAADAAGGGGCRRGRTAAEAAAAAAAWRPAG